MIRLLVVGVFSLGVIGCAHQESVRIVQWDQPDFAIRKHYVSSDVVTLKPAYQTVVCLGCNRESAISDTDQVFWISLRPEPDAGLVEVSASSGKQEVIKNTLDSKHFRFDSFKIVGDLTPLNHILELAQNNPQQPIRIVGHTDSIGATAYNLALSERRAKSVEAWLVDKGINHERITIEGRGEGEPIASNKTKEGRTSNRRTEMFMTIIVGE